MYIRGNGNTIRDKWFCEVDKYSILKMFALQNVAGCIKHFSDKVFSCSLPTVSFIDSCNWTCTHGLRLWWNGQASAIDARFQKTFRGLFCIEISAQRSPDDPRVFICPTASPTTLCQAGYFVISRASSTFYFGARTFPSKMLIQFPTLLITLTPVHPEDSKFPTGLLSPIRRQSAMAGPFPRCKLGLKGCMSFMQRVLWETYWLFL